MRKRPPECPPSAAEPPAGPRISRRRRRLFAAILFLLPFALLLGVEGICRWRGFGGYPPVILHVGRIGDRDWYSTYRPGVDSFFYTRLSHTGGMRELHFTDPKPAGTVRIALFGGSAMQGYPQPLPLTNGAFLEAMLNDVWGGRRRAEVLNLGATAMASFPAVHFLEAMLDHDLDLVVVMSGNNEFYGAYGVCSLHTSGTSPTGMRLARWARGLGLTQWLAPKLQREPAKEDVEGKTLMERMAVQQQVMPEDALRGAAARNLEANLTRMVELCTERQVPVIICTVPTNERDLAPIGQEPDPPRPEGQRERFKRLLAAAETAGAAVDRVASLREAIGLYSDSARAHYLLAQTLTALGRPEEARPEYVAARDLDTMPWRATSAARKAILAAAAKGAVLCDMEAAFREASPGGAIGWELMDDHVHMSLRGQALFAETLLDTMAKLPDPLGPGYLGMIYSRVGRHAEAVALLNDAVRYAKGREGFDIVRALAESLIQVGRPDDARLLLDLSTRDEEMAELSRAMLADLGRAAAPATRAP